MSEVASREVVNQVRDLFQYGSFPMRVFVSPDMEAPVMDVITRAGYIRRAHVVVPEHWARKQGVIVGWDLRGEKPHAAVPDTLPPLRLAMNGGANNT